MLKSDGSMPEGVNTTSLDANLNKICPIERRITVNNISDNWNNGILVNYFFCLGLTVKISQRCISINSRLEQKAHLSIIPR